MEREKGTIEIRDEEVQTTIPRINKLQQCIIQQGICSCYLVVTLNGVYSTKILGRPRGMEWGGRREEGSGWGTHVYLWRIHFDIWQI